MPIFYLHGRDGDDLIEDPEGSDLPNLEAAKEEASDAARDLLAEKLRRGQLIDGQRFEITDEAGDLRAVVWMKEVLRLS